MADLGLLHFEGRPWTGFDVPAWQLTQLYPNNRWHKMFEGLTYGKPWNAAMALELGRYICREFNAKHPLGDRLLRHTLWVLTQQSRPDYTRSDWKRELLHDHLC
jgi:hypothetical protein